MAKKAKHKKLREWTQAEIDECNADMANYVVDEVGELLTRYSKDHGLGWDVRSIPPIFYPEALRIALAHALKQPPSRNEQAAR